MPAGLARRARIVLLAADGVPAKDIVERVGASKPTVIAWRKRYAAEGIGGLADRPKPGRRAVIDEIAVVLATLEPPPQRLGVTHRSSRLLAAELGLSHVTVTKVWKKWGLQPWRTQTVTFSTDPELEARSATSSGSTWPRRTTRWRCAWTKSPGAGAGPHRADPAAAPGSARTAHPRLRPARHHDAVRRLGGGHREGHRRLLPRHRHQELLRFLTQVAKAYPRRKLHLVVDNYATHKQPASGMAGPQPQNHPAPHPDLRLLAEPGGDLLLDHHRQAIRRGSFPGVKDLIAAIEAVIDGWNDRCHPFVWTRPADQLLDHCRPGQRTSFTRH